MDRKFAELRTNLVNYLSLQLLGKQSCFDTYAAGPPQVAGSPEELFENIPAGEGTIIFSEACLRWEGVACYVGF